MGIRYVSQKDNFSCGPTAIVNLLKWLGYQASWKTVTTIREDMWGGSKTGKAMRSFGTPTIVFDTFVICDDLFGQLLKTRASKPKVEDLISHLKKGRAVILDHFWPGDTGGHYSLVIGYTKGKFILVNHQEGETISFKTRKYMENLLSCTKDELGAHRFACMWVFESERSKKVG
jgi:hypothetical protein